MQKSVSQALKPLSIKALLEATDGGSHLQYSGYDVGLVCIVGCVRDVHETDTAVTYFIEDGTGMIPVRHYRKTSGLPEHMDAAQEVIP